MKFWGSSLPLIMNWCHASLHNAQLGLYLNPMRNLWAYLAAARGACLLHPVCKLWGLVASYAQIGGLVAYYVQAQVKM
jgi:hypothetical protein